MTNSVSDKTRVGCLLSRRKKCNRPGLVRVQATSRRYLFDITVCVDHESDLERELMNLGFELSSKTDEKKIRRTYVANSGTPFSGQEARDWLIDNGYDVKQGGRLSVAMIQAYAEAH